MSKALLPLASPSVSIDIARETFELCLANEWLSAERYSSGLATLVSECSNEDELLAVRKVLHEVRYCTSNDVMNAAAEAAKAIVKSWELSAVNTLIVGMAESNKFCGSHAYLRAIENALPRSWSSNLYPNFDTAFRHRNGRECLVLVDDFVGTGDKLVGKIDRLRKNPKTGNYRIFVVVFGGMGEGLTRIADLVDNDIHAYIALDKALSSVQPTAVADALKTGMISLESHIFSTSTSSYSLGYKQTEAAFFLEGSNVPNNVFPVLWWEAYRDDSERSTLFHRR
jgi:hypothetical protein